MFFFPRQVFAAVDFSPILLPAKTSYCTRPCFMCPWPNRFPTDIWEYLGWKACRMRCRTVVWCAALYVFCLLYYIDWMWVGNDAWCRQKKRRRETWGDEWVNVCTLFDVSADLEHSHGWIPWLLMSDLSTGFCSCAKRINSVYGSASASSTAILLCLEGWDVVHLYLSSYFWLSAGVITKANLSLFLLSWSLKIAQWSLEMWSDTWAPV